MISWPWLIKRGLPQSRGIQQAEIARKRAEEKLHRTIQRQPDVERAAKESRELRDRNHFGESIERALRRAS